MTASSPASRRSGDRSRRRGPGVHNSRAIGSPGRHLVAKREEWPFLRAYVHDLLSRFGSDPRVIVWDLYNEPGNRAIFRDGATQRVHCASLEPASHALMRASFAWAREVAPSQPLTVAPWRIGPVGGEAYGHPIDRDALALSDVVSLPRLLLAPPPALPGRGARGDRPADLLHRVDGAHRRQPDCRAAPLLPRPQDRGVPVGPGAGPHPDASALAGHGRSGDATAGEEDGFTTS